MKLLYVWKMVKIVWVGRRIIYFILYFKENGMVEGFFVKSFLNNGLDIKVMMI